jgi:hypothetical protein
MIYRVFQAHVVYQVCLERKERGVVLALLVQRAHQEDKESEDHRVRLVPDI